MCIIFVELFTMRDMPKSRNIIVTFLLALIMAFTCIIICADESYAATDISKCKIDFSHKILKYTGKVVKPEVKVLNGKRALVAGKDYTISFSNKSINPGRVKVTIKGKGKYKGTKSRRYKIAVGNPTNAKATYNGSLKVTWGAPPAFNYYKVAVTQNGKKFCEGTYRCDTNSFVIPKLDKTGTYKFKIRAYGGPKLTASSAKNVTLKVTALINEQPVLTKPVATVTSGGYQRADLSWATVPAAAGYNITVKDYNGTVTTSTIASGKTSSASFPGTTGKKYTFTVQPYGIYEGKTYTGPVSDSVSVTIPKTKIGHATNNEKGKSRGGEPGDQTGKEVCVGNWRYTEKASAFKWTVLIRPKDSTKADTIATFMEQACANDHIGYGQKSSSPLYKQLYATNYDFAGINVNCETACTDLVSLCLKGAKYNVPRGMSSTTIRAKCIKTGQFEILTDPKYLTTDANLKRGDILVTEGRHTVMVL